MHTLLKMSTINLEDKGIPLCKKTYIKVIKHFTIVEMVFKWILKTKYLEINNGKIDQYHLNIPPRPQSEVIWLKTKLMDMRNYFNYFDYQCFDQVAHLTAKKPL